MSIKYCKHHEENIPGKEPHFNEKEIENEIFFDLYSVQSTFNQSDMFTGRCITNNITYLNIVSY